MSAVPEEEKGARTLLTAMIEAGPRAKELASIFVKGTTERLAHEMIMAALDHLWLDVDQMETMVDQLRSQQAEIEMLRHRTSGPIDGFALIASAGVDLTREVVRTIGDDYNPADDPEMRRTVARSEPGHVHPWPPSPIAPPHHGLIDEWCETHGAPWPPNSKSCVQARHRHNEGRCARPKKRYCREHDAVWPEGDSHCWGVADVEGECEEAA